MKHLIKGLGIALAMVAVTAHAASDEDLPELVSTTAPGWQLLKADKLHGITTWYKREESKRFRSFKAVAMYDSSFDAAACHQLDVDNYPRWFMNVAESRVLRRVSDSEFFMYLKLKAPLGVPPRDVPLHVVITPYNAKRGVVTIAYSAEPDYLPVTPGIVRIPAFEVITRISPEADGKSREETEGYAEPGGAAPAWLINYLQRQMPYANSLARSRDIPRYEKGELSCPFKYRE